jgi:hypothetical protein
MKYYRSNSFAFSPLIGYAYTFVIKRHIFIMGSLNGSLSVGFTQLLLEDNDDKVKSGGVFGLRSELILSAGYNSDRWYLGFSFMNMSVLNQGPVEDMTISYDTGMYRMNLVRRFSTKKPIRLLNP